MKTFDLNPQTLLKAKLIANQYVALGTKGLREKYPNINYQNASYLLTSARAIIHFNKLNENARVFDRYKKLIQRIETLNISVI